MKKIYLFIIVLSLSVFDVSAQERSKGKLGFEYGFEWIFKGPARGTDEYREYDYAKKMVYYKDFANHRVTLLYNLPIAKGIYIEPQLSFYHMQYDLDIDICACGPSDEVNKSFNTLVLYKLNESGLGTAFHIGYSFKLLKDLSLDIFLAPDYRVAIKSGRGGRGSSNFLKYYGSAIYSRDYLILKGGVGINYRFLSLNLNCGGYVTDRFLINKDAIKPIVASAALGFKFGL